MIVAQAIVTDGKGNFALDDVQIDAPQENEVLVEIKASGVCHTDFDSMSWGRSCIMGHEGAGVVLECGPGVDHVQLGDQVLLNWAIPCGDCFQCRRGAENICENKPVVPAERFLQRACRSPRRFELGTMASHTVVPKQAVVKIDIEIPFPSASRSWAAA